MTLFATHLRSRVRSMMELDHRLVRQHIDLDPLERRFSRPCVQQFLDFRVVWNRSPMTRDAGCQRWQPSTLVLESACVATLALQTGLNMGLVAVGNRLCHSVSQHRAHRISIGLGGTRGSSFTRMRLGAGRPDQTEKRSKQEPKAGEPAAMLADRCSAGRPPCS